MSRYAALAALLAPLAGHVPDTTRPATMQLAGSAWEHRGAGFAVRLRQLDDEERRELLRRVAGSETDPFATAGDRPPRFATFLLEIQNSGQPWLALHRENLWLVTESNRIEHPLGLERITADYGIIGSELPPAYERIRPALVDETWSLAPGDRAEGLLVYPAVPAKTKRFRIDVQVTLANGDVVRISAPYLKPKTVK
jgi:hypothetical protein